MKAALLYCSVILQIVCSTVCYAHRISLEGAELTKAHISYTQDEVVSRYVDFLIREFSAVGKVNFEKMPMSSSKRFVHISRSADVKVPEGDVSSIEYDGFRLSIDSGGILICAKDSLGLVFGIMELLERAGFRYYLPGEAGAVRPQADIRLERLLLTSNPKFKYRGIGFGEWSLFYRANLNLNCVPERYGRRIQWHFHSFEQLLPAETYYDEHPEYYPMIGGRRLKYAQNRMGVPASNGGNRQINTGNPEVIDIVAAKLAELSKLGKYDMVTLAPNDGDGFDNSPASLALDEAGTARDQRYSRRLLIFYNAVARAYQRNGGTVPIRIGAYHSYAAPPKDSSLQVEKGLVPYVSHFTNYCELHPVSDPNCPKNAKFYEILKGWHKIAEQLFIYEYVHKLSWFELPWPLYPHMKEDAKTYVDLGVVGLYTQYSNTNVFSNCLNYYVLGKVLWNPDVDYDKLRREFFELFYRGVSSQMSQCYALLEQEFRQSGIHNGGNAKGVFTSIYSKATLERALALANDAMRSTSDPIIKTRVDMMLSYLKYTNLMWLLFDKKLNQSGKAELMNTLLYIRAHDYPILDMSILSNPQHLGKVLDLRGFH
jgi:hypothetical protein